MSRSQRYLYFCMFSHVYIFSLDTRYNMTGRLLELLGSASSHRRTMRLSYLQKRYNVHICKCNHIIQNLSKVSQDMNNVWNLVFFALLLQTDLYINDRIGLRNWVPLKRLGKLIGSPYLVAIFIEMRQECSNTL